MKLLRSRLRKKSQTRDDLDLSQISVKVKKKVTKDDIDSSFTETFNASKNIKQLSVTLTLAFLA